MLQGYRTLVFNGVALITILINEVFNLQIASNEQEAIATFVLVVGNIILRLKTKTPIGRKE